MPRPVLLRLPLAALLLAVLPVVPARAQVPQGASIDESGISSANTFHVDASVASTGAGTSASPFKTLQEGLNAARAVWRDQKQKTKVFVRDGVYRESAVLDLGVVNNFAATQQAAADARAAGAVLVIEGESPNGVVIDGSELVAAGSWTQDGSSARWFAPLPANFGRMPGELSGVTAGVSKPNALAYRKELVFVGEKLLEQKTSLAVLTWGCFFIDEAAGRLYIQPGAGFSPAAHPVRFGLRGFGLQVLGVSNLVIRNLTLQRHAAYSENDPPALQVRSKPFSATDHVVPTNVLVERVTSRWNNANGLGFGAIHVTVRDVVSSDNGGGGIAQVGPHSLVENSGFERNGWRWLWGNYYGWTDGALRFNNTYNCTFRNLVVRSNRTKGFWFDTCAGGLSVENCLVEDNDDGIAFEISTVIPGQSAYVVRDSVIRGNTVGVTSMQSEQVQLLGNLIEHNGGWQVRSRVDQNRADPLQFWIYSVGANGRADPAQRSLVDYGYSSQIVPRDWVLRGNTLVSPGDRVPFFTPASAAQLSTLTADQNTYRHPSGRGFRSVNDASSLWFEEWRALAGKNGALLDAASTLALAAPESPRRAALGHIELQQFSGLGGNGPDADPFLNLTLDRAYQTNRPRQAFHRPWTESPPQGVEHRAGQVVRGLLRAPTTGVYRFWLAAEGRAEFRLNASGTTPAGAALLCSVGPHTDTRLRAYDLAAAQSSDAAQPAGLSLVAGQDYYFEVRHLGVSAYPNTWSLAWQPPLADSSPGLARQPIPAAHVTPYTATSGELADSGLVREYWHGIPSNVSGSLQIADLLAYADYPARPHGLSRPAFAEAPQRTTTGYGGRLRGYLVPPVSGQYKFWLAGSFRGEFWLSANASPAHLRPQALCRALGSAYRVWNSRADQNSSGQSPAIPAAWLTLNAGQAYYFELRHTSHDASDHLELAWSRPDAGGPSAALPDEVVPASALLPFSGAPSAPADLQLFSPGAAAFALSWTDTAANERGYRVERRVAGGAWTPAALLPPDSTAYTDSALAPGLAHDYRVLAWNIHGDGPASATVSGATAAAPVPPAAPVGFTALANSSSSVALSWSDGYSSELAYVLERRVGAGAFAVLATLPADTTSHLDSGLGSGTAYAYRLRVLTPDGYSPYAAEQSATPPVPASAPSAPSGLAGTVVSPNQINLVWTDTSATETAFVVQRSVAGGAFADYATLPADTTALSATGLSGNTAYNFRVAARNAVGLSAYATLPAALTTQPNPVPDGPTHLVAAATGPGSVALTWTDNAPNETGFIVERSLDDGATWVSAGANAPASSGTGGAVTYLATGLAANAPYAFRVRATNANGGSAPTRLATATTWPAGSLRVEAAADAYVERFDNSGSSAGSNYGSGTLLRVGFTPPDVGNGYHDKIYLKFDLSAFSGTPASATLELVNSAIPSGGARAYRVYGLADGADGWSETALTWNNAPQNAAGQGLGAGATLLGSLFVPGDAVNGTRLALTGDASSALAAFIAARGADQLITLVLVGESNTAPAHAFHAKEAGTVRIPNEGNYWTAAAPRLLVQTAPVPPAAPSGLTGSAVGAARVDLHWTDHAADALAFALERRLAPDGPWSLLATLPAGAVSHVDEGLSPGATYVYRVRAANHAGASSWSSEYTHLAAATPPLAHEPFDHASGNLVGKTGGSGWAAAWASFNATTPTTSGGSAPFAKAGAAVRASGNQVSSLNAIAHRLLDTSAGGPFAAWRDANGRIGADGGTLWLSVLYTDANATTNDFGVFVAERRPGTSPTLAFQAGRIDSTNTNLGLTTVTSGTSTGGSFATNLGTAENVTRLLVIKVDFAVGADTVTLYVDPDPRGSAPLNPAATVTRTTPDASFDTLQIRAGSQGAVRFDEIRVGATYASVVPTVPLAPTNLLVSPEGPGALALSWDNASAFATGYRVERSATGLDAWGEVAAPSPASVTTYTDAGLAPGATYYYRVRAEGPDGASAYSTTASGTTHTLRQSWRLAHFGTLADSGSAADLADPDADGLPNLLEYALATDPLATAAEPNVRITNIGQALALTFLRARAELTYEVLASSDLAAWSVLATNPGSVSDAQPVTVTDTVSLSASPRRFLRLRVTAP